MPTTHPNFIWSGHNDTLGFKVSMYLQSHSSLELNILVYIEDWTHNVIMPREAVTINGRLDAYMIMSFIERAYLTDAMATKPAGETFH